MEKTVKNNSARQLLSIAMAFALIVGVNKMSGSIGDYKNVPLPLITFEESTPIGMFDGHEPIISQSEKISHCKNSNECRYLAEAGYFEARGEDSIGVVAVLHVIKNRVEREGRWKDTYKGVIYQNRQFSYTHDGSLKRGMKDKKQVDRMMVLSYDVLHGLIESPVGNADHYHTTYVKPKWSGKLKYLYHIGGHIFYEDV